MVDVLCYFNCPDEPEFRAVREVEPGKVSNRKHPPISKFSFDLDGGFGTCVVSIVVKLGLSYTESA